MFPQINKEKSDALQMVLLKPTHYMDKKQTKFLHTTNAEGAPCRFQNPDVKPKSILMERKYRRIIQGWRKTSFKKYRAHKSSLISEFWGQTHEGYNDS